MDEKTLRAKKVAELREIAAALKLIGFEKLKKAELLELLLETARKAQEADRKALVVQEEDRGAKMVQEADRGAKMVQEAERPCKVPRPLQFF